MDPGDLFGFTFNLSGLTLPANTGLRLVSFTTENNGTDTTDLTFVVDNVSSNVLAAAGAGDEQIVNVDLVPNGSLQVAIIKPVGSTDPSYRINTMTLETYAITTTPAADPVITSITSLGGGVFEVTLKGENSTSYQFFSSPTLDFDTGTPVLLTVSGTPNQTDVTTDGSGNATVQMSPGGSVNFVRAVGP